MDFRQLRAFLNEDGNKKCADCQSDKVKYASVTHGSILCSRCSSIHQKLGSDIRPITEEKLTEKFWNIEKSKKLLDHKGNTNVNDRLEAELPYYYRRPWPSHKCPDFLCETFIRAKYIHEEFSKGAISRKAQCHFSNSEKSGYLLKKLRDSDTFCERLFELSVERNFLRYYVKSTDSDPKESIDLEKLNVTFINTIEFGVPPHTILLQFVKDASTRHIFLRSEESHVIVDWYNSIRMGKYRRMCDNYSWTGQRFSHREVATQLTRDLDVAGWLEKTGPKKSDGWRRRWCMLFQRHLLYMDKPLSAFAKGEVIIASKNDGWNVQSDTPEDWKKHTGYAFTIYTTDRPFVFVCDTEENRRKWISHIEQVLENPLTLNERKRAAMIAQK